MEEQTLKMFVIFIEHMTQGFKLVMHRTGHLEDDDVRVEWSVEPKEKPVVRTAG
jgi:hypothetical protein